MSQGTSGATTRPSPAPETTAGSDPGALESTPAAISINGVSKYFRRAAGSVVRAVDELSFDVPDGQMVAVVGPSGCGKTTLLRCVAGLERPSDGEIYIGGRLVSSPERGINLAPEKRGVGMMFQSYALWPHMSAFKNVAYPLQMRKVRRAEIRERVHAILAKVGLAGISDELPSQLSGGMQQRVALARSLVAAPRVILFDEPLSSVDAKVREELRLEIIKMQQELGFAGLYVTHDQSDAMQLCDRLVVLKDGRIAQSGIPETVYSQPTSTYVAEFVGIVNKLAGTYTETSRHHSTLKTPIGDVHAGGTEPDADVSGPMTVLIRPHDLTISAARPDRDANTYAGTVLARMYMGHRLQYVVAIGEEVVRVWSQSRFEPGAEVWVSVGPEQVLVRSDDQR